MLIPPVTHLSLSLSISFPFSLFLYPFESLSLSHPLFPSPYNCIPLFYSIPTLLYPFFYVR